MTFTIRKRHLMILGAFIILAATAITAYSLWSATASKPDAKGKFGSLTIASATPSAAPGTNACFPGSTCDGNIRLVNTGSTPLTITSLTAASFNAANVTGSVTGMQGTCSLQTDVAPNLSIPAKSSLSIVVPPGTNDITIPNLFSVSAAIPSGCQGGTFLFNVGPGTWDVTVTS